MHNYHYICLQEHLLDFFFTCCVVHGAAVCANKAWWRLLGSNLRNRRVSGLFSALKTQVGHTISIHKRIMLGNLHQTTQNKLIKTNGPNHKVFVNSGPSCNFWHYCFFLCWYRLTYLAVAYYYRLARWCIHHHPNSNY